MTTNFMQITPFMHVPELDKALAFFSNGLGFRVFRLCARLKPKR